MPRLEQKGAFEKAATATQLLPPETVHNRLFCILLLVIDQDWE